MQKKTIFVIEASSYQLDYSKIFKSKYSVLLNLSPDHLERHKNLKNYINAKFKLLKNQSKNGFAFVNKDDLLINKELNSNKFNTKIIKVNIKNKFPFLLNDYFLTEANKENLSFVLEISRKLKLNKSKLIKVVNNFKGLKYRQQVIYKKSNLVIINDSKSTSFSSSTAILKYRKNIYWLLGGIYKKGDKFNLEKKYFKNITAYIYGKNSNYFTKY